MSDDRQRWEERYRTQQTAAARRPAEFLVAHADLIGGRVLDVAAGAGRNALFLARRGAVVEGIDIAFAGLQMAYAAARAEGLPVLAVQANLQAFPLPRARYDAVINVRYLQRSLFAALQRALKPGGVILFETFLIDQQGLGHHGNPDFLLQRGELRAAFSGCEMLLYEEGRFETAGEPAYLARMIARRPPSSGIEFSDAL